MKKGILLNWTRIALVVLVCGAIAGACTYSADNAANYGDETDNEAQGEKNIMVLSDLHVMAPELLQNKEKVEAASKDPKMLLYSQEILEKVIENALTSKPDMVMVAGDLTEGGDMASHKLVVGALNKLRNEGIKVLVIPGNHDVNYGSAPITPQQFAELYKEMGFNIAYSKDEASLSYACEPFDGLVLLCIDNSTGSIGENTLTWMLNQADNARAKGKQVAALMHYNIVEHYDGQSSIQSEFILKNYKEVGEKMIKHGIHMAFTGHRHVNDIAVYKTEADSLVDVETGSPLAYPNAWREIKVSKGFTKWDISTEFVKNIPSIADLQKESYLKYKNYLPTLVKDNADVFFNTLNTIREDLTASGIDEKTIPTDLDEFREWFMSGVGSKMCQALMIHFEGNEGNNPESAGLKGEIRDGLITMFSDRLNEFKAPEDKANLLLFLVGAFFDEIYKQRMESILSDENQLNKTELKSVTDDLNTELTIGRK